MREMDEVQMHYKEELRCLEESYKRELSAREVLNKPNSNDTLLKINSIVIDFVQELRNWSLANYSKVEEEVIISSILLDNVRYNGKSRKF